MLFTSCRKRFFATLVAPLTAVAGLAHAGAALAVDASSTWELSTGVDYSAGKYGAAKDTTVFDVPLDAKYQAGDLRLEAMIPYDVVRGPGQLVGGVIVATPGSTTSTTRSGVGDLTLTGAWALTHDDGSMPRIEVAAGVKAPTADKAIGTGETDYFANATLYKSLTPSLMVFGGGGYSWVGSNANYRLKDGATATAGLNYKPDQSMNVGIAYSYRAAIAEGLKAQSMVSPYVTERFSPRFGVTFYALGGLTSDSPRWGAGIRLSYFP